MPRMLTQEFAAHCVEVMLRIRLHGDVDGLALLMDEVGADLRHEVKAVLDQFAVDLFVPAAQQPEWADVACAALNVRTTKWQRRRIGKRLDPVLGAKVD